MLPFPDTRALRTLVLLLTKGFLKIEKAICLPNDLFYF